MCLPSYARMLKILVFVVLFQTITFAMATYFYLADFIEQPSYVFHVTLAYLLSSGSAMAMLCMFNFYCILIVHRIQCINLILNQLIFDEPISKEFFFMNVNQHPFLRQEFPQNNERKQLTFMEKLTNWVTLKWVWRGKEITTMETNIFSSQSFRVSAHESIKKTLNKIWPPTRKEIDTTNDMYHFNNLMHIFNLSESYRVYVHQYIFFNLFPFLHFNFVCILFFNSFATQVTFTRHSSSDFIIHKLNRIFIIFNNLMDSFNILNVCHTKYIFCQMVMSCSPIIMYCFIRMR